MHALVVNYEYPPIGGGAGRACHSLCCELAEFDDLKISVLFGAEKKYIDVPQCGDISYYPVFYKRLSRHSVGTVGLFHFVLKATFELRQLLSSHDFDLVHYFFSVPTGLLSFLHRRRIPYLVSHRGGDVPGFNPGEYQLLHSILQPIIRAVVKDATMVCAVSDALARESEHQFGVSQVKTIPNGIVVGKSPTHSVYGEGMLRLITVSRLVVWKNIDQLIHAVARIKNVKLEIIGSGPEKRHLQKLVIELGVSERIVFVGALPNDQVRNRLKLAHVFILLSISEGMSIAILEAMAEGLPIIGGKGGGTVDLVSPGVNGILVDPANLEQIQQAISNFVHRPETITSFGIRSWEAAKFKFSLKAVAAAYHKAYREIVSENER